MDKERIDKLLEDIDEVESEFVTWNGSADAMTATFPENEAARTWTATRLTELADAIESLPAFTGHVQGAMIGPYSTRDPWPRTEWVGSDGQLQVWLVTSNRPPIRPVGPDTIDRWVSEYRTRASSGTSRSASPIQVAGFLAPNCPACESVVDSVHMDCTHVAEADMFEPSVSWLDRMINAVPHVREHRLYAETTLSLDPCGCVIRQKRRI